MPLKKRFKICIRDPDLAMQYEHSAEETTQHSPQAQGKVTSLQEAALKAVNLCLQDLPLSKAITAALDLLSLQGCSQQGWVQAERSCGTGVSEDWG